MSNKSTRASGDQRTGRLRPAIPIARLCEERIHVQRLAVSGIERGEPLVEFGAKPMELFDMRQQSLPDLFLIGIGQGRYLGDRAFQRFGHGVSIAYPDNRRTRHAAASALRFAMQRLPADLIDELDDHAEGGELRGREKRTDDDLP